MAIENFKYYDNIIRRRAYFSGYCNASKKKMLNN